MATDNWIIEIWSQRVILATNTSNQLVLVMPKPWKKECGSGSFSNIIIVGQLLFGQITTHSQIIVHSKKSLLVFVIETLPNTRITNSQKHILNGKGPCRWCLILGTPSSSDLIPPCLCPSIQFKLGLTLFFLIVSVSQIPRLEEPDFATYYLPFHNF